MIASFTKTITHFSESTPTHPWRRNQAHSLNHKSSYVWLEESASQLLEFHKFSYKLFVGRVYRVNLKAFLSLNTGTYA